MLQCGNLHSKIIRKTNRTERPKFTNGSKQTNHDWPTPFESFSQYHHGKTDQSVYTNRNKYIWLTTTFFLTLMMTSFSGLHSPGRSNYTITGYPGFKPFTVKLYIHIIPNKGSQVIDSPLLTLRAQGIEK